MPLVLHALPVAAGVRKASPPPEPTQAELDHLEALLHEGLVSLNLPLEQPAAIARIKDLLAQGALATLHTDPVFAGSFAEVQEKLHATLGNVIVQAGAAELAGMKAQIKFDLENPYATAYAQTQVATLVTRIDDETRKVIRGLVARGFEQGKDENGKTRNLTPAQVARVIKPHIGLNAPQSLALENRRNSLIDAGLSGAELDAAVGVYREKLLRDRSKLIARTEVLTAQNKGAGAAWATAQDAGLLMPETVRVWISSSTSPRTCPACLRMHGKQAPVGGFFDSPDFGQVSEPPLHPACRCSLGLFTPEPEEEGPFEGTDADPGFAAEPPVDPLPTHVLDDLPPPPKTPHPIKQPPAPTPGPAYTPPGPKPSYGNTEDAGRDVAPVYPKAPRIFEPPPAAPLAPALSPTLSLADQKGLAAYGMTAEEFAAKYPGESPGAFWLAEEKALALLDAQQAEAQAAQDAADAAWEAEQQALATSAAQTQNLTGPQLHALFLAEQAAAAPVSTAAALTLPPAQALPPTTYPPGTWPKKMPIAQAHAWHAAGFEYAPGGKLAPHAKMLSTAGGWYVGAPKDPGALPPTTKPKTAPMVGDWKKKPKNLSPQLAPSPPPSPPTAPPKPKPLSPQLAPAPPPPAPIKPAGFLQFGTLAQQQKQWAHVNMPEAGGNTYWHPSTGKWASGPDPKWGPGGTHVGQLPSTFVFDAAGEQAALNHLNKPAAVAPTLNPMAAFAPVATPVPGAPARYDSHVPGAANYKHASRADFNVAQKQFEVWYDKLPKDEKDAIRTYTGGDGKGVNAENMNAVLYGAGQLSNLPKHAQSVMDALDRAFTSTVPLAEPTMLYRGMRDTVILDKAFPGWQKQKPSDLVGLTFVSKGYTSTSGYVAGKFDGQLQLRIRAPTGCKRLAYIDTWSKYGQANKGAHAEFEVLIARGAEFRILNIENKYGDVIVDCELVIDPTQDAPHAAHP